MKLLITGTTGFVGHKIMESYAQAVAAPSLRKATQERIKRMVEESEADGPYVEEVVNPSVISTL